MQIRLTDFTFLRQVGGECLLFNPRTEAFCLAAGSRPVLGALSRKPGELDDFHASAASELGVSKEQIERDFRPVVDELLRNGLAECAAGQGLRGGLGGGGSAEGKPGEDGSLECVTGFFKRHRIPSELHMDLTSACNERCVHCYYAGHPNVFLPYSTVERVLREFRALQGLTVYLSGGECMLHPEFDRILRLCREMDLNIIVLSNLAACDFRRIAALREAAPQFVSVSLYSMDAAVHDSITRVKGSWRKTMDAFLACQRAGLHLRIAAPLLKENKESFPALERFAKDRGVHLVVDYTIFSETDHGGGNLCHACTGAELESVFRANKELFGATLPAGPENPGSRVCRIGDIRLCINAKGDYYPCDGMHGYVLGNAGGQTMEQVWNGEPLLALRRLKVADFGKCGNCPSRKFCMVCPAFNFNATGNLFEPGPSKCEAAAAAMRVYGEDRGGGASAHPSGRNPPC